MNARSEGNIEHARERAESSNSTSDLGSHYERLAFELDDGGGGDCISGYQCDNPYADELITATKNRTHRTDYRRYTYFDAHEELVGAIRDLHRKFDGVPPERVLCGSGSSSQLFAFATYLCMKGVRSVFFVPPLYFTLRIALERYGIVSTPVSQQQPYQEGFKLLLPQVSNCCLFITDPIWYTGTPVSHDVIDSVARWQRDTSSIVFVDGSFQYLPWNGEVVESTAMLDPSLTVRLICPTKQLAVHGYRFSYLLVPEREERSLAWTYSNIVGAASAESIAFAHEAISALSDGSIPRRLMTLVYNRHRALRASGSIESVIQPSCGYCVFEKINVSLPSDHVLIDGRFFEQMNYSGYVKINLLSPSISIIKAISTHGLSRNEAQDSILKR